jgi:hypothetical protein
MVREPLPWSTLASGSVTGNASSVMIRSHRG